MKTQIYTVRSKHGVTFHIEADNLAQAKQRAESPIIADRLSSLMRIAVSDIASIEPQRGGIQQAKYPIFSDELFK